MSKNGIKLRWLHALFYKINKLKTKFRWYMCWWVWARDTEERGNARHFLNKYNSKGKQPKGKIYLKRQRHRQHGCTYSNLAQIILISEVYKEKPAIGAPMNAESPWHIVTSPNDDVNFSIPSNSAIIIDRYDTNTAERKYNNLYNVLIKFSSLNCLIVFQSIIGWS
jgi:hypothetical protein